MNKREVNKFIENVRNALSEKYGEVKPEWEGVLMCLKDCILRYIQVKESINANGIYNTTTGRKNPLLTTEKDNISTILKLCQKLGVSPWDASKIKLADDEDADDYIEDLTNG